MAEAKQRDTCFHVARLLQKLHNGLGRMFKNLQRVEFFDPFSPFFQGRGIRITSQYIQMLKLLVPAEGEPEDEPEDT